MVSALVAAMPPVVLLAITHLTVHMYQKKAEAAEMRAIAEHDEEAVESEKYGVAYDDGFQAAMADAQAAEAERLEAARQKAADDVARARVEGKLEGSKAAARPSAGRRPRRPPTAPRPTTPTRARRTARSRS